MVLIMTEFDSIFTEYLMTIVDHVPITHLRSFEATVTSGYNFSISSVIYDSKHD